MTITPSDSLDLAIAKGPPNLDLGKQLAELPNAYWAGLDEAYKRRTQDAFQSGVPMKDGQPDWAAISATLLKTGGAAGTAPAIGAAGFDLQRQQLGQDVANAAYRATGAGFPVAAVQPMQSPVSAPSRALAPSDPVPNAPTSISSIAGPILGGDEAARGIPMAGIARAIGVKDMSGALPPDKVQRVQQLAKAYVERSGQQPAIPAATASPNTRVSQGFNDAYGNNAPISRPAISAQPVIDPNSPVPPSMQGREQEYLAGLRARAATGTKEGREQLQKEIQEVGQWMRDRSSIEIEARKAEAGKQVESLNKLADDGIDARAHEGQLDVIQALGRKVGYGIVPKVQSILGHYGIETKGLSDIQAYERAIDFMGPQLRPVGSGRLLQNELTSFKSALGGLMTTPEGREISVNNLKLLSQYKAAVGRVAADTSLTAGQRVQSIYALPPPHLQTEIPSAKPGPTTTVASQPQQVNESQYRALPSGAQYVAPDGTVRTKK